MPVWNGEKYLAEAIASILTQEDVNLELVVVDDGSTDGTLNVLRACRDPRLRLFQREHEGIVAALNFGLQQCRSEIVARQDADDVSHQHRLSRQLQQMRPKAAVLSHTNVTVAGSEHLSFRMPRLPRTPALLALKMCSRCPIVHSTVAFRKDEVLKVGGYAPNERHAEDFGLWGRLMERGEFIAIDKPLLTFRVHGDSISKRESATQRAISKKIAISHCERFLNLERDEAERAFAALTAEDPRRNLQEWMWFLRRCAPRLRWKSAEAYLWLAKETASRAARSNSSPAATR